MCDIKDLRKEIDAVDAQLVRLLEERMAVSRRIGEWKKAAGMPVFDSAREEQKIASIREGLSDPANADAVCAVYRTVFEVSRGVQQPIVM